MKDCFYILEIVELSVRDVKEVEFCLEVFIFLFILD